MPRARTNIELDVAAVATIMDRYGIRTKTEAVDLALRHLAGRPMSLQEALAMRGARALEEPPADTRPRTGSRGWVGSVGSAGAPTANTCT